MTASALARHYNDKYRNQDAPILVQWTGRPHDRFQNAVSLATRDAGGVYLEIGAGDGRCAMSLLDRYDRFVLTDISLPRIEQLKRTFAQEPKITVVQHNIECDELPEEAFNTVALTAVIEHFIDPIGVLKKVQRSLRPGGRVIIDTPNIAKWTRRLKLIAGYFPSTASLGEGLVRYDRRTRTDLHDEGHLHYFTFRSLHKLCVERAGFRRVQHVGYGSWPLCSIWPALFSEISVVAYK